MSDPLLDPNMMEIITLQANIRMLLVRKGMDEEMSLDIASEIVHNLMQSPIVKDTYSLLYQELQSKSDEIDA